jgi:hypothetical protein
VRLKTVETLILGALASLVVWDGVHLASRYKEHLRAMEAGGYEILLGLLLAALTILYWRYETGTRWVWGMGGRHVAGAFGILAAYSLALPPLGYLVSTALTVLAYMQILGGYGWLSSLLFAGGFSVGSAWLWAWLAIALPQGILPWP